MLPTDAAHQAYYRLLEAQQRVITSEERDEMEAESKREQLAARMRRRYPKVY